MRPNRAREILEESRRERRARIWRLIDEAAKHESEFTSARDMVPYRGIRWFILDWLVRRCQREIRELRELL